VPERDKTGVGKRQMRCRKGIGPVPERDKNCTKKKGDLRGEIPGDLFWFVELRPF